MRFPEIFDVSPAQSAERAASVAEAARTDARALQDLVASNANDPKPENPFTRSCSIGTVETCRPSLALPNIASKPKSPLFPAYMPLGAQHRLLSKLQTILESACFQYAQTSIPDVLAHRSWDCAEAAELHIWAKEFQTRIDDFERRAETLGKPVEDILRSAADIRHAAVHRLHLSARGLENFILDAEFLTTLLGDEICLKRLSKLRRETVAVIEELERNKHILASSFEETKKKIAAQRKELDQLEKDAEVQMTNDDREYQMIAGSSLDRIIAMSDIAEQEVTGEENDLERYHNVAESCDGYSSELEPSADRAGTV